jgi:hypothetical protein
MRALCIALALTTLAGGAAAAAGYTAAEKQFCGPEAKRLCAAMDLLKAGFGSYGAIVDCFKKHRAELSRDCVEAIKQAHPAHKR